MKCTRLTPEFRASTALLTLGSIPAEMMPCSLSGSTSFTARLERSEEGLGGLEEVLEHPTGKQAGGL